MTFGVFLKMTAEGKKPPYIVETHFMFVVAAFAAKDTIGFAVDVRG